MQIGMCDTQASRSSILSNYMPFQNQPFVHFSKFFYFVVPTFVFVSIGKEM